MRSLIYHYHTCDICNIIDWLIDWLIGLTLFSTQKGHMIVYGTQNRTLFFISEDIRKSIFHISFFPDKIQSSDIIYLFHHFFLTLWGWVMHLCVGDLITIGSDNGLSPDRRQAIIWNNAGILSTVSLGTNFSEISVAILAFSFKKMWLKVSRAK